MTTSDKQPEWNQASADRILGLVVLVGITREEPGGDLLEQVFGTVLSADPTGITLRLGGSRSGETFWLPPDLASLSPAGPGSYRLRSTGEIVNNPDFTASWVVKPPRN